MERASNALVLLVAGLVLLAGCAGKGSKEADLAKHAPEPTASGDVGSIAGSVWNEEDQPIVGAEVGLRETAETVRTDDFGNFTFNELPPAVYTVDVSRLGYGPYATVVTVVAGEILPLPIVLQEVEIPQEVQWRTIPYEGYIQCSYNPYYFVNTCPFLGENDDNFVFELDPTRPLFRLLLELVWTPSTSATGQELELDICLPREESAAEPVGCAPAHAGGGFYAYRSGRSPVVMNLTANLLPLNDSLSYQTWIGNGLFTPQPTIQQAFTLYVSECYYADCPKGFTGRPPE